MKALKKLQKFEIFLSNDDIMQEYSLYIEGYAEVKEIPADISSWESDFDYYGYRQLEELTITHIVRESEESIDFIDEEDLSVFEYGLFSKKLNILMGF